MSTLKCVADFLRFIALKNSAASSGRIDWGISMGTNGATMKTKHPAILPILATAIIFVYTPKDRSVSIAENSDFDIFCDQFTQLVEEGDYSELTAQERALKLDTFLTRELLPSSNAYQAWAAIRNAAPDQRSMLYRDAAKSAGYEDWECPAVEAYGSQVGSH